MHIIRESLHILIDAFHRFNRDDGWAIVALSILMSVFPFLIVVTAIAGFIWLRGSCELSHPPSIRDLAERGSRARSRPKSTMC